MGCATGGEAAPSEHMQQAHPLPRPQLLEEVAAPRSHGTPGTRLPEWACITSMLSEKRTSKAHEGLNLSFNQLHSKTCMKIQIEKGGRHKQQGRAKGTVEDLVLQLVRVQIKDGAAFAA